MSTALPPMHAALSVLGTMAGQYLAAQSAQAQSAQAQPPQTQPVPPTRQTTTNAVSLCDVCNPSMHVAPSIHPLCRFATRNLNTSMERRPTHTAARHVLPRFRTRLRHAVTLLRGEGAPRPPLVPKLTCVTYVALFIITISMNLD